MFPAAVKIICTVDPKTSVQSTKLFVCPASVPLAIPLGPFDRPEVVKVYTRVGLLTDHRTLEERSKEAE